MSRVITFSKVFPKGHPRQGERTDFAAKILDGRKKHTIRAGHRYEAGEYFHGREWSDRPYASKQVSIAEDMPIVNQWPIEKMAGNWFLNGKGLNYRDIEIIAMNDGLTLEDFLNWFKNDFDGQIICWDETIQY